MSNNRFNCCQPIECAYMFIRRKQLSLIPVFETPTIKLWANEFKGYTGDLEQFECDVSTFIGSDKVIYETNFIAEIAGDEVAYFADYEDEPDPLITTVVSGAIVLPKKYEGMAFDNTVTTSDGKIFYQFVKGKIPDSIQQILAISPRTRGQGKEEALTTGVTAGDDYKNVVLFPVYYTDFINESLSDSKKQILFSLDSEVTIRPGVWKAQQSSAINRILWPPDNTWGSYLCFQGIPDTCGGIPFSYFQTIPETVDILTLTLAVCETEDKTPIVSITETNSSGGFSYQKALIDSDASCYGKGSVVQSPESVCPPKHPNTRTVANELCAAPQIPVNWSTDEVVGRPFEGLGKDASFAFSTCFRQPVVSCDPTTPPENRCEEINCANRCPEVTHSVVIVKQVRKFTRIVKSTGCVITQESEGYDIKYFNLTYYKEQYDNFKSQYPAVSDFPPYDNGFYIDSSYSSDVISTEIITITPPCSLEGTPVEIPDLPYSIKFNDTCSGGFENSGIQPGGIQYYASSCPTNDNDVNCCCCGYRGAETDSSGNFVRDEDGNLILIRCETPPPFDVTIIKHVNTTNIVPNPFLIYLSNGAYYDNNKILFTSYLQNYLETYITYASDRDPKATEYKFVFNNPLCSNGYGGNPPYLFVNPDVGLTAGVLVADPDICSKVYKTLPNPLGHPRKRLYTVPFNTNTFFECRKNVKYPNIPISDYLFKLACSGADNPLVNKWPTKAVDYYGTCKNEGVTLTIQVPIGLTLTNCTNILSWEVLKNAPK